MAIDALITGQRDLNRATAGHWTLFAEHRERLMAIIHASAPARSRIAIAGAGNCNDLDLRRLAADFAEVHLVDIDGEAVEQAVDRQGAAGLRVHAGVDLSGVWPLVDLLRGREASPGELDQLIRSAESGVRLPVPAADLAVSAGVLTQLLRTVGDVIGESHPRIVELATALRGGHVRTLLDAVRPGGRVLLVTEVVSSEVIPAIGTAADAELPALLHRAIWSADLFTGVSPAAFVSWLSLNRPAGARLTEPLPKRLLPLRPLR